LTTFLFFKLLLLLDSYLSAEFIFSLREYYHVDLSQSSAAQNILIRSSTIVAPTIALMLLVSSNLKLIILFSAIAIGGFSTLFLRKVFFSSYGTHSLSYEKQSKALSIKKLISNPLMKWGFIFQICGNLSFAGVSFIFLSGISSNASLILNEITLLYFSFFLAQSVVLIFGEKIVPANKYSHVGITIGICGILVLLSGISDNAIRLAICSGIGLTYSCSLSAVQKVLVSRMQGPGYTEYVGWAQMMGRLSSIFSTITIGLAVSAGFSPSILLSACGLLGVISAILLILSSPSYKNKEYKEEPSLIPN